MKKTTLLKKLIKDKPILLLPVVHDALCAKIAQHAGFKAISVAGYANSASLLGKPDVSLLTLTEMVDCVARIADSTDLPILADGDTGHGNVTNVIRTIKLHEKAGVAGIFIEDQIDPKRCGHMSGKQVIPKEEMVAKLKAALDSRLDNDFVIMARTDAIAVNGIDDAIERAIAYQEAGVDLIFIEAPENIEQMKRITKEISIPTLANMIPGGKTPLMTGEELEKIGFAVVAYPTSCTYIIAKAAKNYFEKLYKTSDLKPLEKDMIEFTEFNKLVGLDQIRAIEKKYYKGFKNL
ncbi:MAG: oxaloacetate decarboxylase [Parachlamydiales bacterium]|nr:oxaloacetate decarboxylase [Parachlamydiales bacterium]